jgi:CRISPR-associated protein (TIGR03986 family)
MPLPVHDTRTGQDRNEAHAPYNFVPLPERVVGVVDTADHAVLDPTRHTGRIECTLTTGTPLYIRAGYTPEDYGRLARRSMVQLTAQEQAERALFFHHGEQPAGHARPLPVIPGSSLRGMVRNIVAIVSASRVAPVNRRQLFHRTMANPLYVAQFTQEVAGAYASKVRGGFLRQDPDGNWLIDEVTVARIQRPGHRIGGIASIPCPVPRVGNTPTIHVACGALRNVPLGRVTLRFIPVTTASVAPGPGLQPATLVVTKDMPGKHFEFVFLHDHAVHSRTWQVPQDVVDDYQSVDQITRHMEDHFPPAGRLQAGQPIFFLPGRGTRVEFIGRAQCFRIRYGFTVQQLLEQAVPSNRVTTTPLDLAESLFGYVRDQAPQDGSPVNRAGRVTIGDARLANPTLAPADIWFDPNRLLEPEILSAPKPTTYRHYLVQTNNMSGVNAGVPPAHPARIRANVNHMTYDQRGTTIRGHKLYWHHRVHRQLTPRGVDEPLQNRGGDTQRTRMCPVKAGVSFTFTMHYDNLTSVELGALLWAVRVSAMRGTQRPYRLKLGMGKPLGLGSVHLDATVLRQCPTARYGQLFDDAGSWNRGEQTLPDDVIEHFIKVFELHQLASMGRPTNANGQPYTALRQTPRVQDMLRLLRWPDEDTWEHDMQDSVEYMPLNPDFTLRRVLGVPANVPGVAALPNANLCPLPNAALAFGVGTPVLIDSVAGPVGTHPTTRGALQAVRIAGDNLPPNVDLSAVAWDGPHLTAGCIAVISGLAASADGRCMVLAVAPLHHPAALPQLVEGAPVIGIRDANGNVAIPRGLYSTPSGVLPGAALAFGVGTPVLIDSVTGPVGTHPTTGAVLQAVRIAGDNLPPNVDLSAVAWAGPHLTARCIAVISGLAASADGRCMVLAVAPPHHPAALPQLLEGAPVIGIRDANDNVAILIDGLYTVPAGVTIQATTDPGGCRFAGHVALLDDQTGHPTWDAMLL